MVTRTRIAIFAVLFFSAGEVQAGMPSPTLADVRRQLSLSNLTRMRLETISFFLLGLLVFALVIRVVWNGLRTDFPRLPRLSYGKALGLVALWGLLFVLVLTMISGARELMTPGAWEKKGLTYQLVEEGPSPVEQQITGRHQSLERLGQALRNYAEAHRMAYPVVDSTSVITDSLWVVPEAGGGRYVYKGGVVPPEESPGQFSPLVYEPDVFGPDRLVLMNDGSILWLPIDEINRLETQGKR